MNEQWALLWSQRQNALHIEPVERMLSINRTNYASNTRNDYLPLFIGGRAEVDAAAANCRRTLMSREFGEQPEAQSLST